MRFSAKWFYNIIIQSVSLIRIYFAPLLLCFPLKQMRTNFCYCSTDGATIKILRNIIFIIDMTEVLAEECWQTMMEVVSSRVVLVAGKCTCAKHITNIINTGIQFKQWLNKKIIKINPTDNEETHMTR